MGAFLVLLIIIGIVKLFIAVADYASGKLVSTTTPNEIVEPVEKDNLEPIDDEVVKLPSDYVWHRTLRVRGTSFRDGGEKLLREHNESIGNEPYNGWSSKEIREELKEFGGRIYEFEGFSTTDFELVREPNNPVDENAVMVVVEGYFVGYVSRGYAKQLQKYIGKPQYSISGIAEVYGGNYKYFGETRVQNSKSNVGCKIDLQIKKLD